MFALLFEPLCLDMNAKGSLNQRNDNIDAKISWSKLSNQGLITVNYRSSLWQLDD